MNIKNKKIWPILTLVLLAPLTGEVISGSSPPTEFFQPMTLILLTWLYGFGALFSREIVRRWHKGWLAVFLLGCAYGIFEEGIIVRSFFDPAWPDLGLLANYGRWLGVNWVWSISLTIFHAAISITIPILLTELVFPDLRCKPWLGKTGFIITGLLFLSYAFLSPFFGMKITFAGMIFSIIVIILLAVLAKKFDFRMIPGDPPKIAKPFRIALLTFISMVVFIFLLWGAVELGIPAVITFIAIALLPAFVIWGIRRIDNFPWKDAYLWSAAFGALLPWIIISFFSEFQNAARPDDTRGMALFSGIYFLVLVLIRVRILKRIRTEPM